MAKKCPECPACLPGWLVQFGDLMSLLLVFFILLLSMAVMDKQKVEEYFDIMKKSMGFLPDNADIKEQTAELSDKQSVSGEGEDKGTEANNQDAAEEVAQAIAEYNEVNPTEKIQMDKGKNEFTLNIPSALMFEDGQYELTNQGSKNFISKLAKIIRTMPQNLSIEVIGHTDRSTMASATIPRDSWDLSALRSISVVKELIKNKIDPEMLKVASYAQYRPKSDNAAENRRVEIRFFSDNVQKDVIEEANFFDRLDKGE